MPPPTLWRLRWYVNSPWNRLISDPTHHINPIQTSYLSNPLTLSIECFLGVGGDLTGQINQNRLENLVIRLRLMDYIRQWNGFWIKSGNGINAFNRIVNVKRILTKSQIKLSIIIKIGEHIKTNPHQNTHCPSLMFQLLTNLLIYSLYLTWTVLNMGNL